MFGNQSSYQLAETNLWSKNLATGCHQPPLLCLQNLHLHHLFLTILVCLLLAMLLQLVGAAVDVGDTSAKSHFGDQRHMPMYTYAQPFQGQYSSPSPEKNACRFPSASSPKMSISILDIHQLVTHLKNIHQQINTL